MEAADTPLAIEKRGAFLARMAHEVRTPLTTVIGVLDMLKRTPLSDVQARQIALADTAATDLLELADRFMLHAALEEGLVTPEARPFSVGRKVAMVLDQYHACAQAKGVTLTASVDPKLATYRLGDPEHVLRILSVLVDNAVRFTDSGAVTIDARCEGDGQVCVDVADTGPGFPQAMADDLFKPFRQGDVTRTRHHDGAGLGLAIAQGLARMMGGVVEARGEPDRGATFTLSLPLPPAEDAPAALKHERRGSLRDFTDLRRTRVMLVDDNSAHRKVLTVLLEGLGHHVEVAEGGRAALDALERRRVDIILMDLRMPEMDGFEAARAIRALPDGRSATPIVGISADTDQRTRSKALAAGMNAFASKRVVALEIARVITQVLGSNEDEPSQRGSA